MPSPVYDKCHDTSATNTKLYLLRMLRACRRPTNVKDYDKNTTLRSYEYQDTDATNVNSWLLCYECHVTGAIIKSLC